MPVLYSHVQTHPTHKADKADARQTSELFISKYIEAASHIHHKLGRTGQAFFVMDKASLTARDCNTHTQTVVHVAVMCILHTLLSAADHKEPELCLPKKSMRENFATF